MYLRLLAMLMTLVVSGIGLLAVFTQYAPERWTRFGYTAPLEGHVATVFGLSVFFFGLLPLMLTARSPRTAAVFGSVVGTLGMLCTFIGVRLMAGQ